MAKRSTDGHRELRQHRWRGEADGKTNEYGDCDDRSEESCERHNIPPAAFAVVEHRRVTALGHANDSKKAEGESLPMVKRC